MGLSVWTGISRLSFQRLEQCADVTESAECPACLKHLQPKFNILSLPVSRQPSILATILHLKEHMQSVDPANPCFVSKGLAFKLPKDSGTQSNSGALKTSQWCQVVRFLRCILGDRLGEFYDEEGEADLHALYCSMYFDVRAFFPRDCAVVHCVHRPS